MLVIFLKELNPTKLKNRKKRNGDLDRREVATIDREA